MPAHSLHKYIEDLGREINHRRVSCVQSKCDRCGQMHGAVAFAGIGTLNDEPIIASLCEMRDDHVHQLVYEWLFDETMSREILLERLQQLQDSKVQQFR